MARVKKDLIGNYQERISETVKTSVDGHGYDASQITTESVKIEDPGEGKELLIRHFFFAAKPMPVGTPKPTKLQLFAEYKGYIGTQLWADGLEPAEERTIEVHTRHYLKTVSPSLYKEMLKNNTQYVIMVPCRARKGFLIHERPNLAL